MLFNSDRRINKNIATMTDEGKKYKVKETPTVKELEALMDQKLAGFPFVVDHWRTEPQGLYAFGFVVKESNLTETPPRVSRVPCAIHKDDLEEVLP